MNPELIDLLIFVGIVCGPILAVGVAFNLRGPLGRALAARIRNDPETQDLTARDLVAQDLAVMEARLEQRLLALERSLDAMAIEIERQGEWQRMLLARPTPTLPAPHRSPVPPPASPHNTPAH